MHTSRRLRKFLILGLLGANILVWVLAGYALNRSRQHHEARAEILTQNSVAALEQNLTSTLHRIDQALLTVVDEIESRHLGERPDERRINAFIDKHEQRVPEIEQIRVTDARGQVILGYPEYRQKPVSAADRDYFIYLRDHPDAGFYLTKPIWGRIVQRHILIQARRYHDAAGRFAGVVYATINIERFTEQMSRFNLGDRGTLILRDSDLGLIARHPPIPDQPAGQVGNQGISKEFRDLVARGVRSATYQTPQGADGYERILTFHYLDSAPMLVLAGMASEDYLAPWRAEVREAAGLILALLLFTVVLGRFLLRLLVQSEHNLRRLRDSEAFTQSVLDSVPAEIAVVGRDGTILAVNEPWQRFARENGGDSAGPPRNTGIGANYLTICQSGDEGQKFEATEVFEGIRSVMEGRQKRFSIEYPCHSPTTRRWFEMVVSPLGEDASRGVVITHNNITHLKEAEEQLRIAAATFDSQEGIVITDANGHILRVNRAFCQITGYEAAEVIGQTPRLFKSGRHDAAFYRDMWSALLTRGLWQGEVWDRRKNGEVYPKWLTISAVRNEAGAVTHYVGAHHDITERKKAEERIRQLAFVDQLTGLPNRTTLHDRLEQVLPLVLRNGRQLALMLIDLDNFKIINDTLGHQIGDDLLMSVAERLSCSVRQTDVVARLGGDEFVVVLPDIDSPQDAAHVAEKIIAGVSSPYGIEGHELRTSPSIGICLFPDDATEVHDLIKKADAAMYHAKANGRANYQFFRDEIQQAAVQRLAIESDLRKAIVEKQFLLHYQPQLDLRTGRMVGVEALIRWQHPQRGLVSPLEFIPIAEETGLIVAIGDWVLEQACRQMSLWKDKGLGHVTISINLTASQFLDRALPYRINALIAQFGIGSDRINLEITESMSMASPEQTIASMKELTASGLTLSIDDFGTGYSSLSYLKMFPVRTLKIDRSFVKDIETDQNDAEICDVTVLLAHKLGLDVVAEGVETEAQLKYLLSIGCERIQGYLVSKPLPVDQVEKFLLETPVLTGLGTIELWSGH